jgi:uncharacterized protein
MATKAALRARYSKPIERARIKVQARLDEHCRRFIAMSPFVCLGTQGEGGADVSPRGDEPGFVHVVDEATLALPDWPGNNRLDSMENITENRRVGLLFLVPGVNETLRVNGEARISEEPELLARWDRRGRRPKSALVIGVAEAYFHCGRALIRARLWDTAAKVDRAMIPSYGAMLHDQIVQAGADFSSSAEEIDASVEDGYRNQLY